jgi:DNA-binding transcriptional LysR family regulator
VDLSQLKRFIITVEGGSLGKAAEMLNISQPGLSKSMHQLEADLGGPLLDRGPKGVTSTAFGEAVYLRAKRIHLTAVSGVAEELARALRLGDLDFAVAVLDNVSGTADLVEEVLFYDRCGIFVDAAHALASGGPISIESLAKYCWLFSTDAASLHDALNGLAQSRGVEPRKTFIDSNSVVYLASTLIGSDFIGLLSMDSVEDAVDAGHLVELILEPSQRAQVAQAAVERPIGFLRCADTTLSPIALALRDEILALCIKLGYPLVSSASPPRTS